MERWVFEFHQWWVQISVWPGDRLPQGVVCTLHEGDDFGKLALVNDAPRAASIVLREDNCHFLRVDKEDFNRILRVSFLLPSAMKRTLLPSVGEHLAVHQQYQRCYCHLAANFILAAIFWVLVRSKKNHSNFETEIFISYYFPTEEGHEGNRRFPWHSLDEIELIFFSHNHNKDL